jgi:hypothetical protein
VRSIVSAGIIVSEHEFRFKETKEAESFMDEIKKDKFLRLVRIELEIVPRIYALNNYKEIKKLVNDLKNSVRNDVNHAGFREKPRTYDDLKASLLKRYNQFLKLI